MGRARKSVKPEDIEQYKSFAKNLKVWSGIVFSILMASYFKQSPVLVIKTKIKLCTNQVNVW